MKKNYKKLSALFGLLCAVSMPLGAQLNGLYTINSLQANSSTNFQTFQAFATAINSGGVTGAVVVEVVANTGPYIEQIQLNQIAGATAANKVTINGNGCLITYNATSSGSPWTIGLNGTDYLTINNLNVQGQGTNYAFALALWNNANYNNFSACSFSVPANCTSSYQIPVNISGTGNYYQSSGNSGNYNIWDGCTMFSGYVGVNSYGSTSPPFTLNNEFRNCLIRDFYYAGVHAYFADGMVVKKCIMECPTRTNSTTRHGIYFYATQNSNIEENWVRNLFNSSNSSYTGTAYGIYVYYNIDSSYFGYNTPSRYPNNIRNNIISDITFNGSIYGIYAFYFDGYIYNNSIILDHAGATGGSTYGIYTYGQQSYYIVHTVNNLVSITRGGSGTKYAYFNGCYCTGSDMYTDRNNFYVGSTSGTNYVGLYTTQATNNAALATQGANQTGYDLNPNFVNAAGMNYHPQNTTINNKAIQMGLTFDQKGALRNATTPDIGALEFLTPVCTGIPAQVVTGPSYALCPGENADFSVAPLSSDDGFTYQWQYSTQSNVGLWTQIPSAKGVSYVHPNVTQTTWVSAIITCTAAGGQQTTSVAQVDIAGATIDTAAYYENFDGIGKNGRLPNCSWTSPQLGGSAKTYVQAGPGNLSSLSGPGFASFNNTTPGTSYYYTNQIYMYQGVTYSASVWYQSDLTGAANWTDLSILYGTSQTAGGLTSIVSTNGPAIAAFYKPLSKTFQVPSSGYYNVAIRATSKLGAALNLSIDDLRIEIPCQLNSPTITASANSNTICQGEVVVITASGGDNYLWSNNDVNQSISVTPQVTTTYAVTGSSALSGCGQTVYQTIEVNPSPVVIAMASSNGVCVGKPVTITAGGALTYVWSNGGFGPSINATSTTTAQINLSVIGTNQYNCTGNANVIVNVFPNPPVNANVSNNLICEGDAVTLSGSGAASYQWLTSNNFILSGSPITYYPAGSGGTYTLTGTDANGCSNTSQVSISAERCTGITTVDAANGLRVYPNPTSGAFTVEMSTETNKTINVTDVTGRVILQGSTDEASFNVNINQLAAGVYYVKVSSGNEVNVIKVVKQ
jgi:hypothetical protein